MSMTGNYVRVTAAELERLRQAPQQIEEFLEAIFECEPEDRVLDIEKAWQGIHYLLTGDPLEGDPPLADAVMGGRELGDVDLGYGPARYLEPKEVKTVAEALGGVSDADLRARFDPAAMTAANIYPWIWDEGDEALDYLLHYYRDLVAFFRKSPAAGDAVLEFLA